MKEVLHGLKVTETSAIVTVSSNGCTGVEDFRIELQKSAPPIATWIRIKPDPCDMLDHSIDLEFSPKQIGAAEFKIGNTLAPGPPPLEELSSDED